MLRKIGLTLVCASGLVSTSIFASVHPLAPNVSVDWVFHPKIPETLSNVFFWTVKASCTISSANSQNKIHVHMKKKSAKVNEVDYPEGYEQELTINSGDKLVIAAASGAQVELTNMGDKAITASCSTV